MRKNLPYILAALMIAIVAMLAARPKPKTAVAHKAAKIAVIPVADTGPNIMPAAKPHSFVVPPCTHADSS